MNRVLGLIFIFVTFAANASTPQLLVNLGQGQDITCQQKAKSPFWVCDGDKLLFIGETIVGQTPTIHDLKKLDVRIPNRIVDLATNKETFGNPLNFQYQQPGRTAADSFYRKFNMMTSFEPRLRACAISECRKLKSLLHSLIYRQNQITLSMSSAVNFKLNEQADSLAAGTVSSDKSEDQLKAAYSIIKKDSSLRYDYLRDGSFARAEVVAAQLADKGFEVYKVWVHGFSLWSYHNQKPADLFGWRFHVAPAVRINGQLWVVDPGFFTTPVKPHMLVSEVFGPNQKLIVTNEFVEDELAVKATVAVSLTPWEVYPNFSNTTSKTAEEISADVNEAKSILEELDL